MFQFFYQFTNYFLFFYRGTVSDNYYSEGFDSEPQTSLHSSSTVRPLEKNEKIKRSSLPDTTDDLPYKKSLIMKKMQTERRKSTSFLLTPSTPLSNAVRQRRYSSGSDESVIFSQAGRL